MNTEQLLDGYLESIIKLIENDSNNVPFLSPAVLNNKEIALKLVSVDGYVYKHLSKELQADRDVTLAAVKNDPYLIEITKSFIDDSEIVIEAIKIDGSLIRYASKRLKNEKDIALLAMKSNVDAFEYLSKNLRDDIELIKIALEKNGIYLEYTSKATRNNKELVLWAIKTNGLALEYASQKLQNDIDIVKAAVKKDGKALQFASDRLKNNKTIVLSALKKYPILHKVHDDLKKDLDIVLSALYYSNRNKEALSRSIENKPAVQFMLNLKEDIPAKQWPFIKKALLEHTDAFLNPPDIIKELIGDNPNKYLILAENAFKQKSLSDLANHIEPDIDFCQ